MGTSEATKAAANHRSRVRRKVLTQMTGGLVVCTIPVLVWWRWAYSERQAVLERVRTQVRVPNVQTTDDLVIENQIQPGDVILFDRKCETCASSPWAAFACVLGRTFLCNDDDGYGASKLPPRSVDHGKFDHIGTWESGIYLISLLSFDCSQAHILKLLLVGLVVPGYIQNRNDLYDPSNLLLLEATPQGIVARSLKSRLEHTQSRSVLLLQLSCPGEKRNNKTSGATLDDEDVERPSQPAFVVRTREHVEKELKNFRDRWVELGKDKKYDQFHSTVAVGGALSYALGLHDYVSGPVSPSAYLVVMGLQKAAAAQNISEGTSRCDLMVAVFLPFFCHADSLCVFYN